jgi:restriction endonuclease Mrr
LGSPLILIECKNWSKKVGSPDIRNFVQKIMNRPKNLCRVGFIITMSNFTKAANNELLGYRGKDFIIATAEKEDIEKMINDNIDFSSLLKSQILRGNLR